MFYHALSLLHFFVYIFGQHACNRKSCNGKMLDVHMDMYRTVYFVLCMHVAYPAVCKDFMK